MRWYLFLIQLLRTLWQTLFRIRQSSVMIETPPWINNRIKKIIYERNSLYKVYRISNDTHIFGKLTFLQKKLHGFEGIEGYLLL